MGTKLSINLNAVALLRNRRNLPWPNMLEIANIGLNAGASGITIHPRPDERHIRYSDIKILSEFLNNNFPTAEFNIEGYPSDIFLDHTIEYADQITLVPDSPAQSTSDHGWDIATQKNILSIAIDKIKQRKDISVSVFVNPGDISMQEFKDLGADKVEIYTGIYGACYNDDVEEYRQALLIKETAEAAMKVGLKVNAGHDLTLDNLSKLLGYVSDLNEISIGHSLISEALIYGMDGAVRRFLRVINGI